MFRKRSDYKLNDRINCAELKGKGIRLLSDKFDGLLFFCPIRNQYSCNGKFPPILSSPPETLSESSKADVLSFFSANLPTDTQHSDGGSPSHWMKYMYSDSDVVCLDNTVRTIEQPAAGRQTRKKSTRFKKNHTENLLLLPQLDVCKLTDFDKLFNSVDVSALGVRTKPAKDPNEADTSFLTAYVSPINTGRRSEADDLLKFSFSIDPNSSIKPAKHLTDSPFYDIDSMRQLMDQSAGGIKVGMLESFQNEQSKSIFF